MDVRAELAHIQREYSSLLERCEVQSGSLTGYSPSTADLYAKILQKRTEVPYLVVKQKDEAEINVTVDVSGWYVLRAEMEQKRYETFEALMMARSKAFRAKFADELTSRLTALVDESFSEDGGLLGK